MSKRTYFLLSILLVVLFLLYLLDDSSQVGSAHIEQAPVEFDKSKWKTKENEVYPFRDQLVNQVLYNDTIRTLKKEELIEILGKPDRINDGHLYYLISKKQLGLWTLHAKTLVIKMKDDDSIEWIKIHE